MSLLRLQRLKPRGTLVKEEQYDPASEMEKKYETILTTLLKSEIVSVKNDSQLIEELEPGDENNIYADKIVTFDNGNEYEFIFAKQVEVDLSFYPCFNFKKVLKKCSERTSKTSYRDRLCKNILTITSGILVHHLEYVLIADHKENMTRLNPLIRLANPLEILLDRFERKLTNEDEVQRLIEKDEELILKSGINLSARTGKIYYSHDNGGRPFRVYLIPNQNNTKRVEIYRRSKKETEDLYKEGYVEDQLKSKNAYRVFVTAYDKPLKVFIGKSILNPTTEFSGGHGSGFDGNSILIQIGPLRKIPQVEELALPQGIARNISDPRRGSYSEYVFIGWDIYEFTSPEEITQYYSTVGNNDVPYPVARTKNYALFMADHKYVDVVNTNTLHPNLNPTEIDWSEAYSDFYGINVDDNSIDTSSFALDFQFKVIAPRQE